MPQNSHLPILFLSLILLPIIFSEARKYHSIGGWKPIGNINNPHVTEIAEFAVGEYNKESKTSLKFEEVIKGETQVIAGISYRLTLKAKDENAVKTYETIVCEQDWLNSKYLISFNPIKADLPAPPS